MDDELRDPVIGQVADVVREPVTLSSGFDERVMAMVERVERVEGVERLRRRRSFLGAQALLAASIAALMIGSAWIGRITAPSTPSTPSNGRSCPPSSASGAMSCGRSPSSTTTSA